VCFVQIVTRAGVHETDNSMCLGTRLALFGDATRYVWARDSRGLVTI
jgi:hypothetical protein